MRQRSSDGGASARRFAPLFALAAGLVAANACHSNNVIPTGAATTSGTGGATGTTSASTSGSSTGTGGSGSLLCPATITFQPGAVVVSPKLAGDWEAFDLTQATAMTGPTAAGVYTATVNLTPGLHGYKVVYGDGQGGTTWALNPSEGRRTYIGGVENSAVKVRDCSVPALRVSSSAAARPASGQGTYNATLAYVPPVDGSPPDPTGLQASLVKDGVSMPLSAAQASMAQDGTVTIAVSGLADGKYRVVLAPRSQSGKTGEPLRLVFWVESEAFEWNDALLYMIVTDRYRDGDPTNNPPPEQGADPRTDYKGGDLAGVTASIEDGTLDALGVRALWLTPFNTGPTTPYIAADGVHLTTGYHGYWPVKGREVDPRIGGDAALHAMVTAAHAHGIRVLQDYVLHHVHEQNEYVAAHPNWFKMGCVCGTNNCDWTAHAQDCVFATYLPNIDYTVPEATAQITGDAVYWLDTFDLDGLRLDAVKHVPEIATRNTAAEVREAFDQSGQHTFLMGETAMGWNNCADPCNDQNYGTIAKYIGPLGLDGQFDFVLYSAVADPAFASGQKGMLHVDYWFQHGQSKWPAGSIMTPYIGSHDTSRFATLADYRGQDAAHDPSIPGNQWSNTAVAPTDGEPYRRARIAMPWLINLPGAPLLYYGDEYGQWGGADPNNRQMWRPPAQLSAEETATLSLVRKLGQARKSLVPLRRGAYTTLSATDDTLVFGRKIAPGNAAIVAVTRLGTGDTPTFDVLASLGFSAGTVLHDALGGPDQTVAPNGTLTLSLQPSAAMVLHP